MSKKFWHELSEEQIQQIIKERHPFGWIMENYKQPAWCNHPNAIAAGAFGCEKLMNKPDSISSTSCINCKCFNHK